MPIRFLTRVGNHLQEKLEEENLTLKEASYLLGWKESKLEKIISGKKTLSEVDALKLEEVFSIPSHFWNAITERELEFLNTSSYYYPTFRVWNKLTKRYLKHKSPLWVYMLPGIRYLFEVEEGFTDFHNGILYENDLVLHLESHSKPELHILRKYQGSFCLYFYETDEQEIWTTPCDCLFNIAIEQLIYVKSIREY